MSENTILTESDFRAPGEGSANIYGLNKRRKLEARFRKDWVASEIKLSAQLNPLEPYRRVEFDPVFYGVFKKIGG